MKGNRPSAKTPDCSAESIEGGGLKGLRTLTRTTDYAAGGANDSTTS
jgi:hypothetical protein